MADVYDCVLTQSPSGPTSKDIFGNNFIVEMDVDRYHEDVDTFMTTLTTGIASVQRNDISIVRGLLSQAVAEEAKKRDAPKWRRFRFDDLKGARAVVNGLPTMRRNVALFEGEVDSAATLLYLRGCYYHNEVIAGPDGNPKTISTFDNDALVALAATLKTLSNPENTVRLAAPAAKGESYNDVRIIRNWKYLGATEHDVTARKRSKEEKLADAGESLAQELLVAIEDFVETHGAAIGPIGVWLAQPGSQANTLIGKIVALGAGATAIALIGSKLPAPLRVPVQGFLSNLLL